MPQVFISHKTEEDASADKVADLLEQAGFTVWVDHRNGITPNDANWDKAIRTAIQASDFGVFLMSEKSLEPGICQAECQLVLDLDKPLYVARLKAVKPENVWLNIKMVQYADLVTDFNNGVEKLIRAIKGEPAKDLPTPSQARITGGDIMRLHLPFLNNPLRGRDEDLQFIQSDLGAYVLQIVGTGGLGKSRLCAEIARNYKNGAVWHRCEVTTDSNTLLIQLRQHVGVANDATEELVLNLLQERKPLVVIDNAEEVAPRTPKRAEYVSLLQKLIARGVSVLLTTRVVWDELKPRKHRIPTNLMLAIATQLTLDFAHTEGVPLTEAQAKTLAEAGKLHPRLIEFAVGQLHERSVERVVAQLNTLTHIDIKDALDEMVNKTVAQMSAQAKHGANAEALLRRLAILRDTFDLWAIQALAPETIRDIDTLEDALVTLQQWQFVRREDTRYRLGDLVREALGLPTDDDVFAKFADYYITIAQQFETRPPEEWRDSVDIDLPNIRFLGDELAQDPSRDWQRALAFAENTIKFVFRRMEERKWAWLEMGLQVAQHLADKARQALFMNVLGNLYSDLGDKSKALAYYEQALPLYRLVEDKGGEAATLNNIGSVYANLGDKSKALAYYEQALPLYRLVGDKGGEAATLNNIGSVYSDLGDKSKALAYYEQALPLYRLVGNKGGEANTLNNVGSVYSDLGDKSKALAYYEQALPLYRLVGDKGGEANALNNVGSVYSDLGDKSKALAYYEQALPLYRLVGNKRGEANTLNNIGIIHSDLGHKAKALLLYQQSLPFYEQIGDRHNQAAVLTNIGSVYADLGEQQLALSYYEVVLPMFREIGYISGEAITLNNVGLVYSDLGDKSKALAYYEQALPLYRMMGDNVGESSILNRIAFVHYSQKKIDEAILYLEQCIQLETELQHLDLEYHVEILKQWKDERDAQ
jgi:tetratricopeptide (TPR) repeat protein